MDFRRRHESPSNVRGGQVSYLLFGPASGSTKLSVTWVTGDPGSQQARHTHPDSEQVYVIVRGQGVMIVDGEEQDVGSGSAVLVHPGQEHAIRNTGQEPLEYISATSPPFPARVTGDRWELET